MSPVSLLRKSARVAAIVSTLVSAAFPLALAAPAAAAPCSDIEVIFARGTNDAPDLGRPGQAFADALRSQVGGRTVSTYGVNYPASYDFL
ncbi:cutinase family protein, partial [Mycolicibacterium conceptionense]